MSCTTRCEEVTGQSCWRKPQVTTAADFNVSVLIRHGSGPEHVLFVMGLNNTSASWQKQVGRASHRSATRAPMLSLFRRVVARSQMLTSLISC